jgi:RES domain-containing protein
MYVYRLSRTKWAKDLTGEGARLNSARWNHPGIPCVYTSESRALALIEYSVNINLNDIPRSLTMVTIEIPDDVLDFSMAALPGDWKTSPAPNSTKDFGSEKLKLASHPVLRVPSVVLPEEFNYLLNPAFPKATASFKIVSVKDFVYDLRIKTV